MALDANVQANLANLAVEGDEVAQAIIDLQTTCATGVGGAGQLTTDLASTAHNKGAEKIGVEDAGGHYTAANVEAALAEVKIIADAARPSAFTAGTAGNWTGAAPTTIQAAIDRIAAALAGLTPAAKP